MPAQAPTAPARVFLDTGVIVEGCFSHWGASKAVLILLTLRAHFTVVLSEVVEHELRQVVAGQSARLDAVARAAVEQGVAGWLNRVRIERHPAPTADDVRTLAPTILPALRHVNDLAAVVAAMQARPNWVLSTNTAHWNARLERQTGLRIATPFVFLEQLVP